MKGKLRRAAATVLVMALLSPAFLATGCAGRPDPMVAPETAKEMIAAGEVRKIYQPRTGHVQLFMRDGRTLKLDEPYSGWIVEFVNANGHRDKLDGVVVQP